MYLRVFTCRKIYQRRVDYLRDNTTKGLLTTTTTTPTTTTTTTTTFLGTSALPRQDIVNRQECALHNADRDISCLQILFKYLYPKDCIFLGGIETTRRQNDLSTHFGNNSSTDRETSRRHFMKVSKGAKIRSRYNQVPHPTKYTNGKVTDSQLDTTNESQEVSPFPAGDHKLHINRCAQRHSKHKTEQKHKRSTKEVPPWNGQ